MKYVVTFSETKAVEVEATDGLEAHNKYFDLLKLKEKSGEIKAFEIESVEDSTEA